ncbi:hypothetical protein HK103_003120 [Boothiomyces macroporosus]|uniref:Uncharacterized protein n=1 Tax=Boothiomyces macroporosus TaxID=261099 RepID=A0AAD5ULY6_9FUNG|nr:hypothetical protein HK103_003120 [Boothiomyces macroporosus]
MFRALALVGIAFAAPSLPPLTQCPSYESIYDADSLEGFQQVSYQGEWYVVAHNEPTEPRFCECDRMTWIIDPTGAKFNENIRAECKAGWATIPLNLGLSGTTATNSSLQGYRTEGSPPLAGYIPNMVLYVDQDPEAQAKTGYRYTSAIVYSCQEHYLFQNVFASLQIFSRDPNPGQDKINSLIQKAVDLGVNFDPTKMKIPRQTGCNRPESTTCPAGFCPSGQKCTGGMVGVPGVPAATCA